MFDWSGLTHVSGYSMCFHKMFLSEWTGPHTMLASQQRSLPRCNNLLFSPTSCRCSFMLMEDERLDLPLHDNPLKSATKHLPLGIAPLKRWPYCWGVGGGFHLVTPTHINMQRVPRPWICNLKGMAVSRCKILNNLWGDK